MKPGGATQISSGQSDIEDKTRKTLHTLQPAAKDKENLVGAGRALRSSTTGKGSAKDEMSEKTSNEATSKEKKTKKNLKEKTRQAEKTGTVQIEIEDLTSEAGPSDNYWQILAERRRVALEDALEENRELTDRIEKLEEENQTYKEMLDETRALVEVLQDMVGEDRNDINNSLDDSTL